MRPNTPERSSTAAQPPHLSASPLATRSATARLSTRVAPTCAISQAAPSPSHSTHHAQQPLRAAATSGQWQHVPCCAVCRAPCPSTQATTVSSPSHRHSLLRSPAQRAQPSTVHSNLGTVSYMMHVWVIMAPETWNASTIIVSSIPTQGPRPTRPCVGGPRPGGGRGGSARLVTPLLPWSTRLFLEGGDARCNMVNMVQSR